MKFKDFMNGHKEIDLPENADASFRPSVYAIIEEENNILLIKDGRSNEWEFPGGGIEIGQSIDEALSREIKEETGYKLKENSHSILHVMDECYYHGQRDKYYHGISLFFKCELKDLNQGEQELDSPDEITDVNWFSKEEILELKNFAKYHQKALQLYLEKK